MVGTGKLLVDGRAAGELLVDGRAAGECALTGGAGVDVFDVVAGLGSSCPPTPKTTTAAASAAPAAFRLLILAHEICPRIRATSARKNPNVPTRTRKAPMSRPLPES